SGQQVFYPFPRLVAYIVPVNAFIFFHASHFTSFPLSSPHYLAGVSCPPLQVPHARPSRCLVPAL
ncbi:hypothetical protein, partial [Treponema endosymbiont of Eucomonympha sp.]|uniref:hypothetical protein n=1 Tax=Treponema endosymbiont of Eucomonympha sp. TaxID=1580831 RepID=UPI001EE6F3D4